MVTVKQVSERLRISASLVYRWCEDHLLPHYRMGGKGRRGEILIEETALDAFVQSRKGVEQRNLQKKLLSWVKADPEKHRKAFINSELRFSQRPAAAVHTDLALPGKMTEKSHKSQ